MSALTAMPARVPFGVLDSGRLQTLQNTKNRQNALPSSAPTSLKRRAAPVSSDKEDYENLDPRAVQSSGKRTKNTDGTSSSKFSITTPEKGKFFLTHAPPSPDDLFNPIKPTRTTRVPVSRLHKTKSADSSVVRKSYTLPTAPYVPQPVTTQTSTPTPVAAGRSPKSKRIGILSRKRTSSPFTRVNPPANKFLTSSPLSIDAALSGTIPSYKPSPARSSHPAPVVEDIPTLQSKPMSKDWFFDIHEDTLEDTLTNIMEFSTGHLDISDDESRRAERADKGKENIPPPEDFAIADAATTTAAASINETTSLVQPTPAAAAAPVKPRRNAVRHAKRSTNLYAPYRAPLADLPPTDFADAETATQTQTASPVVSATDLQAKTDKLMASTLNQVVSADDLALPVAAIDDGVEGEGDKEIQIWESGSAADEAERAEREEEGVDLKVLGEIKPDVAMS